MNNILMGINILVRKRILWSMEKEDIFSKIEVIMKANGIIIWCMEKGYCIIQTERYNIKASGNQMSLMVGDKCIHMKHKDKRLYGKSIKDKF